MTAEIAILNKSAAVLAADSAVTIGNGGSAKIFNTANKIFEVSNKSPIGLMIFNRLDFMDLPLEVLAKEFRARRGDKSYATVRECRTDFLGFLQNEVRYDDRDELGNFAVVALDALESISRRYERAVRDHIQKNRKVLVSKFNGILADVLSEAIDEIGALERAQGFKKIGLNDSQKAILDNNLVSFFQTLQPNQKCKTLIYRFVALCLTQDKLSSYLTGLVFAGFGSDEICPSLDYVEMDGILGGKLKVVEKLEIDIGRDGPQADIVGFAQDDMVQSFVNGVDPSLREYSQVLVREAIESSARLVLEPIFNDQAKLDAALAALTPDFDALSTKLKERRDQFTERYFTQDVKNMVRSMPKEELANLAESLIDITSLKRKVTRDRETVGGEVDVAVISRSEGLVWVRRKHYFPADINSRFFGRMGRHEPS